ncbi:unnamed protein product [Lactuca saligna]|uniref:tRNA pseudouridine synthase n=1 Tax=Lactuca saligna TaxID=75948 RepID=A0AA36DXI4_LACSI|nr:unnamed protein product [Lactuca saligna]
MGYAALGVGLPLAAAHLDDLYNQQTPPANTYKWRLFILRWHSILRFPFAFLEFPDYFLCWQYQPSTPTLQCLLEQALTRVTKLERKDLCAVGVSRTDAGVYAFDQVAQFVTPFNYKDLHDMHATLNGLLPLDVRIREINPALLDFHARFSVTGRIYHYKIYNDTVLDLFHRLYAYHKLSELNVFVMKEAAKYFVGQHDFSSFANKQCNDRVVNPGPILQVEVKEEISDFAELKWVLLGSIELGIARFIK